jgi:glycosyltransferase involved in cell wall biosynthesis
MTKYEAPVPQGKSVCVGTVAMITRDKVSAPTAISMMMSKEASILGPDEYIKRYIIVGNVLTFQRNACVQAMEGDWILFIDSDMVWKPQDIVTLIETQRKWDLDVVGGLCFQRSEPYQPTLYKYSPNDPDSYTFMEKWEEDTAVEVDATGMAFCLIHKRVFDRILQAFGGEHFPDFEERQKYIPVPFFRWGERWGEDFQFCREAKDTGSRIFVDTSVKTGHVGDIVFNEKTFWQALAVRPPIAEEVRRQAMSTIGEEVLTADEALAKIRPWENEDD